MNTADSPEKLYIREQDLMLDGFRLGKLIHQSGFRPDYIVGIWRGGSAVGIVVQECLQYLGVDSDHIPIRTSYTGMQHYPDMVSQSDKIRVHGLEYLIDRLDADHQLLLVDDVFSSGFSMQAVIEKLRRKTRQNMPAEIRTAVPWYRPVSDRTAPDYFIHQTDKWLVLPYELSGLSVDEIKRYKSWAAPAIESINLN